MGLLNNLKRYFGGSKVTKNDSSSRTPTGYEVSSYGGVNLYGDTNKRKYLEAMQGWVYAAVSAIADEIGGIELRLYKSENGNVSEVKEHKAIDVLYHVNDFTTKYDQFWLTETYLDLTGESPWFVEKDENGEPMNIFFLRPDRLTPIADKEKIISGYVYILEDGEKIPLNVDEVIFFKNPNPANPFRGRGPLEAAAKIVDIDNEAENWNFTFFKNSARPDIVLTVKDMMQMDDEQKEKLKKSIRAAHQGTEKAHEVMVLFGDMEIGKFGYNQSDMDFIEQQKFGRDKILAIFRVPKAIIAQTEGVNYASAKSAQHIFARFTLKPKMERITQQLNEFYLPMFNDSENLFFDYVNPVSEDNEVILKRYANGLQYGWLTINEVREEEGKTPIAGFDVPLLPLNVAPLGDLYDRDEDDDNNPARGDNEEKPEEAKNINPERLRQLRARNPKLADFDNRVIEIRKRVKDMVKGEMKKKKENTDKSKTNKIDLDVKNKIITKVLNKMNVTNDKEKSKMRKIISNEIASKVIKGEKAKEFKAAKKAVKEKVDVIYLRDSAKKRFWQAKNAYYNKYHKLVKKAQITVFKDQQKRVLKALAKQKKFDKKTETLTSVKLKEINISKLQLDEARELRLSEKKIKSFFDRLFEDSANATFVLLGVNAMSIDMNRADIKKKLQTDFRTLVNGTTKQTNLKIEKALIKGIENEEGINDISKRIRNVFKDAVNTRSVKIAETETARFNSNANEQAFIDSGVVAKKQWHCELSPCDHCDTLQGKTIALGTAFLNKGDTMNDVVYDYIDTINPPLHPHCVCDIVPVLKSGKDMRDNGRSLN